MENHGVSFAPNKLKKSFVRLSFERWGSRLNPRPIGVGTGLVERKEETRSSAKEGYATNRRRNAANLLGSSNMEEADGRNLRVATWNVASINNNPFEYFVSHDNPAYLKMMQDIEKFMISPGEHDVTLGEIISDRMFEELAALIENAGIGDLEQASEYWEENLRDRRYVLSHDPLTLQKLFPAIHWNTYIRHKNKALTTPKFHLISSEW